MAQLISIVGSTGVGKTSLARALAAAQPFSTGYEQHDTRPFQMAFKQDVRFALANQLDYMLLRAEQEAELRQSPLPGLLDGGLEQDFYGFTHLFHARSLISADELNVLTRLYRQLRALHPLPELFIYLHASGDIIRQRLARRDRINIATPADVEALDGWLNRWLDSIEPGRVLRLDVSAENETFTETLEKILKKINSL